MLDTILHKGRRAQLVRELTEKNIYRDTVIQAIGRVPRHLFIDPALDHIAYADRPLPLPAEQTISQPSTVALQTTLLDVPKGGRIMEIGTGCGYQTAVLAEYGYKVFSIERQHDLYVEASRNLSRAGYTAPIFGDGYEGLTNFAPFDGILIACCSEAIPNKLLLQLKLGAKIVMPLLTGLGKQEMFVIQRTGREHFERKSYGSCSFVPMIKGVNR
jgi:protein-L-isoaspartate(D-aspartate) O-methyltransferase